MTELLEEVATVAHLVRYWAEDRADCDGHDLNGWCAKASAYLFTLLRKQGIKAELHAWCDRFSPEAHVYVVVDEHIVDVTATQFRAFRDTPVVIMHQREAQPYEYYQTVAVFHSVDALRRWQKKECWPFEQIAYPQ